MKQTSTQADRIVLRALRACVTHEGIVAGTHHFVDLWARDSLFASFGANTAGLSRATKKTIETFLQYQREDGLIPYLILRSRHTIGKYFGRHSYYPKPVAHFRSHMSFGIVPDGGLMTMIAAWEYASSTGDNAFLRAHYAKLHAAYSWYRKRYGGRLISEWYLCEWADAVLKSGNTLYTNVLYFRASVCMEKIAVRLGKARDAAAFRGYVTMIRRLVHKELWTGRYFADWKDWHRRDYFAAHPNMLAIVFGLATKTQAESILSYTRDRAWNGWTLMSNYPAYPLWRIPLFHTFIGMGDYHNGLVWLQPGILYAVALGICGHNRLARSVYAGISDVIRSSGGAHEVYGQNGIPVRRSVYRSENPFAWSAGLYLWAGGILNT